MKKKKKTKKNTTQKEMMEIMKAVFATLPATQGMTDVQVQVAVGAARTCMSKMAQDKQEAIDKAKMEKQQKDSKTAASSTAAASGNTQQEKPGGETQPMEVETKQKRSAEEGQENLEPDAKVRVLPEMEGYDDHEIP